ncbi:MAG: hypothetical protein LBF77_10525 [Spirochaetaceae bacterium]|nr:hypothetical protein [Spirochaetaceae bacterium]
MNTSKQILEPSSVVMLLCVLVMAVSCDSGFTPGPLPPNPPPLNPGRVSWYVSDAPNSDRPSATAEWSGGTIKAALRNIKSNLGKVTGGRKAVIVINGAVTAASEGASGATMVTISGSYPPLAFRGDGINKGVIDGGGSMRIFLIKSRSSGIPNELTLADNLILQNGRAVSTISVDTVGGAVCVQGGTFNMTGGAIKNSVSTSGGAIAAQNWGMDNVPYNLVNLSGGEITGCGNDKPVVNLDNEGAAVYIIDGKLTISGTVNIHDNGRDGKTGKGGAIYLTRGTIGTELTMSGGTIRNNAAGEGGGVYVGIDCAFSISNGTITGNTAARQGGGVYLYKSPYGSASYTNTGGTVSGNTPNDVNP